jgi:hypothetical protein
MDRSCVHESGNHEIMVAEVWNDLDGGSVALAEPLQHTFFVIFRRKM